jgi:hypothetical protein
MVVEEEDVQIFQQSSSSFNILTLLEHKLVLSKSRYKFCCSPKKFTRLPLLLRKNNNLLTLLIPTRKKFKNSAEENTLFLIPTN